MKEFKFKIGSQTYNAAVSEQEDGALEVVLNGKTYHVELPEQKAAVKPVVHAPAGAPAAPVAQPRQSAGVTGAVTAPLPGTIKEVLVAEGAKVKAGQVLAVMEAMKMANDIVAESDGTVGKVHVAPGQSVNQGDVLVDFVGAAAPAAPAAKPAAPAAPAAAPKAASVAAPGSVTSPLPGTVKAIVVKVGDKVQAGQKVAVVEAMKMENDIVAESAGTVKSIPASVGAQVQAGEALVELA